MILTQVINGSASMEPVDIRLFVDNSLVEIFVNDRTVLASHVYPALSTSNGFKLFAFGGSGITVNEVSIATNLSSAWPSRPVNTAMPMIYDSPNVTSNYTFCKSALTAIDLELSAEC